MNTNNFLALTNAVLICVSTGCLAAGFLAVRRRQLDRHRAFMLAAFATQTLFLVSFIGRFVVFGPTPFVGDGPLRLVYVAVLYSHEPLSVVAVPLAITTLTLGLTRRFLEHRQIAPLTFAIWTYSSVTGVLIYALLYLA